MQLFEGGVRGTSFVTGGLLPAAARGKTRTELMQVLLLLARTTGRVLHVGTLLLQYTCSDYM